MLVLLLALLIAAVVISVALALYATHRIMTGNDCIPLTVSPAAYGLPFEPVSCRTSDGLMLKGWFVPAKTPSSRTILFCHGWSANKGEILKATHALAGLGFNLLYFDFRHCGESEGDLLSVGYWEARDFDACVAFMRAHRPGDRYAVYGMSMGGLVAFSGAARHGCFDAAVIESTFRSHDEAVIRYMNVQSGVPYYPLIPMVLLFLRLRIGADPMLDTPEILAPNFKIPLLGICGDADRLSPPELVQDLFTRLSSPTELWIVPGGGHARCAEAAGAAYAERLARFYSARFAVPSTPTS